MITHCNCGHEADQHRQVRTAMSLQVTFIESFDCLVDDCHCKNFYRADF